MIDIPEEFETVINAFLTEYDTIFASTNEDLPTGWLLLTTEKVKIKIPHHTAKEISLKKIDYLEEAKIKVEQETFQKLKYMDEQIQSLLAIENNPGE